MGLTADTPPTEPPQEGNFTFVFTDIEGSTKLTKALEDSLGQGEYEKLRDQHRDILLPLASDNGGYEAGRAGDGHFFVFEDPHKALAAVIAFQNKMPVEAKVGNETATIKVRVGIHRCHARRKVEKTKINEREELYEYPGDDTNFAARIGALGVGGQVIVSESFVRAVWGDPVHDAFRYLEPEDREAPLSELKPLTLRCWPSRRLKSYETQRTHVFEVLYDRATREAWNEPGSRFFPEFFVRDANRYIERSGKQEEVYAALLPERQPKQRANAPHGGIAIIRAEGGMGKTRLAVTCAIRASGNFADGTYFVSLAIPQTSAEQGGGNEAFLVSALLAALPERRREVWGLTYPLGHVPPLSEVLDRIFGLDLLLVLDNYESLVPDVGRRLLRRLAISHCHVLLTTRVHPNVLGLGDPIDLDDGMARLEAHELLTERIRQNRAGWQASDADIASMDTLMELTAASPLALELASSRAPELSLSDIVEELRQTPLGAALASFSNWDDEIAFERHRSIVRTLDWSFGLLKENARRVFATSGLFADSFTKEALIAVGDGDSTLLMILIRSSLIRQTSDERYFLHHIARAYARLNLLGGEVVTHLGEDGPVKEERHGRTDVVDIEAQFTQWYSKFIRNQFIPTGLRIDTEETRTEFAKEKLNILAAVTIFCTHGNGSQFYDFGYFGMYLERVGDWLDEAALYAQLLKYIEYNTEKRAAYSWIIYATAKNFHRLGKWEEAASNFAISRDISHLIGDSQCEAASLNGLANVLYSTGRWNEAIRTYHQSIVIQRKINDLQGEAASLHGLANALNKKGQRNEAIQYYHQSIAIKQKIDDFQGEAASLQGLANVLCSVNQWHDAIQAYLQIKNLCSRIGDLRGEIASLASLAVPLYFIGKIEEAIDASQNAINALIAIGDLVSAGVCLRNLANHQANSGRRTEAIASARRAVLITEQTQDEGGKRKSRRLLAVLEGHG